MQLQLPAHESKGSGPEFVHEDAEGKGGGAEQERANGEAQVEHLLLGHATRPHPRGTVQEHHTLIV